MRILLLLITFSFLTLRCQDQTKNGDLRGYLLSTEQELMDAIAIGDIAVWDKYLYPTCLITTEDGKTMTKKELLASMKPLPTGYVGRIEVIEPKFHQYDNTAVLNFVLDEYLELYNQKIHTQYRQQSTWKELAGEWRLVAYQVFEIPKNPIPVTLPLATLKQYEGSYSLNDVRKCDIFVKDGKLMAKKNNREAEELLAETVNVFFRKSDGRVRVLFVKNDTTNTFQMIERRAGEDLIWK